MMLIFQTCSLNDLEEMKKHFKGSSCILSSYSNETFLFVEDLDNDETEVEITYLSQSLSYKRALIGLI